ncbi:alpha/beta hydrolase [Luteolibacter pohnpeiensis]|uniref:Alpha/beta hydrolase n=1 Tax=Luteolibacter pohnpeiensis TaxID=454153 RepID=A0A934S3W1_9BACT|nr:alpha/beta hydrolase [Luteolibacter pohnpeiensis]MBK1881428.1 alpha/beta hydrolase [Luteolibacter pohnpeiensis]
MNAELFKTEFIHRFVPAPQGAPDQARTLVLLHGTGGNENDLLQLGRSLAPDANLLSPRGRVSEHGMPRFFRRLAEGVFDEKDLIGRTHELAEFIGQAAAHYGIAPDRLTALGFSNGANIAASLLLLRPEVLSGAILWRAMVPLVPDQSPDLTERKILLTSGTNDPILPLENARRLAGMFRDAGAQIDHKIIPAGHQLTEYDIDFTRAWLKKN